MKKHVVFDKHSAKKLVRNSRHIDYSVRNSVDTSASQYQAAGLTVLQTTTQITGLSGAKPGTGSGKRVALVNGSYTVVDQTTFPILNNNAASVASGAYVLCGEAFGQYIVVDTSCKNVTQPSS